MTPNGETNSQIKAMLTGMAAETEGLKSTAGGAIADLAVNWLLPQYLLAVRGQLAALPDGPERLTVLRLASNDLVSPSSGEVTAQPGWCWNANGWPSSARMERDRNAEFWKWTRQPEIRRKLYPRKRNGISKTTLRKIERELRLL